MSDSPENSGANGRSHFHERVSALLLLGQGRPVEVVPIGFSGGGRVVGPGLALDMVELFLNTEFEGGRHQTRVDMITALEND